MRRILRILLLCTLFLAGGGTGALSGQEQGVAPGPSSGSSMSPAEFEALFHSRAESRLSRFTEADVHFYRMMIPHHSQALEMSALAPDRTENPTILTLAARISGGQEEEISRMRQWLRTRGLTEVAGAAPETSPDEALPSASAHDHGAQDMPMHDMPEMQAPEHSMPGLLTPAEMEELAGATGPEFDRLYLSYMIKHHRGAIQMVEDLFATDDGGKEEDVFLFAAEIRTDQSTEVARMERMLTILQDRVASP